MTQRQDGANVYPFVAVVWEYDAAPDAEETFFVWEHSRFKTKPEAVRFAENGAEYGVGAAVFLNGKRIFATGCVDECPEHLK